MGKKVIDLRKGLWAVYGDCPKCGMIVTTQYALKECHNCGTSLTWPTEGDKG
jgi:hypothetical protein